MNRRLATLASGAIVAATLGLVGPASPASAAAACAATGTVNLSAGIGLPTAPRRVGFTITADCANGGTAEGRGELDASCGLSTSVWAEARINGGAWVAINVQTAGGTVNITGGAHGGGAVAVSEGSCANGTATKFTFAGAIAIAP